MNMKYLFYGVLIAMILLFMTGCTHTPEKDPITVPVEVKVPIAIKCKIENPKPPEVDIGKLAIPKSLDEMGILLMRENEENRRYANELKAALDQCSE